LRGQEPKGKELPGDIGHLIARVWEWLRAIGWVGGFVPLAGLVIFKYLNPVLGEVREGR